MTFQPQPNQTLTIAGGAYRVAEHPAAPGMPFGQEGRKAIVYQLIAGGEARALKVFKPRFRSPALVAQAERLAAFANIPGMRVCDRVVLTPQAQTALLREQPDLTYAVLMPWIAGDTWQGVMLAGQPLTPQQAAALARQLTSLLAALEKRGIAHCDLSAPNVLLPGLAQPAIHPPRSTLELVDVEDLFAPGFAAPPALAAGSPGYAHKSAPAGLWSADADRFAGAVLIAEMLGWGEARVRQAAWGESYFEPSEMQTNSERYQLLYQTLKTQTRAALADLFARAWFSETLDACPSLREWASALDVQPVEEIVMQPIPAPAPQPEENLQARLARAKIESGEVFLALGDMDRAVADLDEAYRLHRTRAAEPYARALLARGEARERANDFAAALADYRKALDVTPDASPLKSEIVAIARQAEQRQAQTQHASASQRPAFCGKCGKPTQPEWTVCPYCGSVLGKTANAPKPAAPAKRAGRNPVLTIGALFASIVILAGLGLGAVMLLQTPEPKPTLTSSPELTRVMGPVLARTTPTTVPITIKTERRGNDNAEMVFVPAGEFTMGSNDGSDDEKPVHTVYLDAFWIDKLEVTNALYKKCVDAGKCPKPGDTSSNTRKTYYGDSQYDNYPVIYVSWNDARAYCDWAGKWLPSEAEWEKAARGTDARTYPWGNEFDARKLNSSEGNRNDTTQAGMFTAGASPYGALDMAGNVWEWTADWYDENYYTNSPRNKPAGPSSGQYRVLRGGALYNTSGSARAADRLSGAPANFFNFVGFRCARSL